MNDQVVLEKYKLLQTTKLTEENFNEYLDVIKYILKNFDDEEKKTVSKLKKVDENSSVCYKVYTDRLKVFITYFLLFSHRYINMLQGTTTKFEIRNSFSPLSVFGFYDPSKKVITYGVENALRFGDDFYRILSEVIHENRHARQFAAFATNSIEELLQHDPNTFFTLKDFITINTNNKDFYMWNHEKFLLENDAHWYGEILSHEMISKFVPQALRYYNLFSKNSGARLSGNYSEEIEDHGTVTGEYRIPTVGDTKYKTVDKYIYNSKCTDRMAKTWLNEYKFLQLFYDKNGVKKSYREIMKQRDDYLNSVNPNEKITVCDSPNFVPKTITIRERVNTMFDCYIKSDPMLYLENLLFDKPLSVSKNNIIYLFGEHPTLYKEYKEEIDYLFKRKINSIKPNEEKNFNSLIGYVNKINITHGIDPINKPNKLPSISGGPRKH